MSDSTPPSAPKTIWDIDRSHPEKAAALRTTLNEVKDPEMGYSIVQLGMVREAVLRENDAAIRMILTTPFCPYGPSLMENARQRAEKALGVPVVMEMGDEAWDFSMMEEDAGADWGLLY